LPAELRRAYDDEHGPELLPSPDDDLEVDDLEELDEVGLPPLQEDGPAPDAGDGGGPPWWEQPAAPMDLGEVVPDPAPAKIGKGKKGGKAKGPRPTVAVRTDVHAKIRFLLVPSAQIWQARDPICGSVAVQVEPGVSESLTAIVCQSPDLLAWFTGPAGGFMVYFDLFSKLLPLFQVIFAHHVAHSIGQPEGERAAAPNAAAYAA
jgi:hypothetical protein